MIANSDIEVLKNYFKNRKDVAFAFLFGSQANGRATKLSDIDIAVYFYPKKRRPVQYEEEIFYKNEDEVYTDVEQILKNEVEMLVLNRVYASVAASAIGGTPLAINDWGLYLDFMEVITSEAEDFMTFIIDDYMERSAIAKRN